MLTLAHKSTVICGKLFIIVSHIYKVRARRERENKKSSPNENDRKKDEVKIISVFLLDFHLSHPGLYIFIMLFS